MFFSGFVSCKWSAHLEKNKKNKPENRPSFVLCQTSGVLQIGEINLIEVIFEPQHSGVVMWSLVFTIEYGEDDTVVKLKGIGLVPTLKIEEENIDFDSTLPYVSGYYKTFTIENISPFPIEYFFGGYDK